jgi:hypothetical protein
MATGNPQKTPGKQGLDNGDASKTEAGSDSPSGGRSLARTIVA